MIEKIVLIPDSFKNTMESQTVCDVIKETINVLDNDMEILCYPIADGGEGTALIFSQYLNLEIKKMCTTNAFNKNIEIEYGSDGKVAVIDIASVVGFAANPNEVLNPQKATTYGIGKVLKELINQKHKKIYIGLGGSITNDLGMGMIAGMGVKFYNMDGNEFIPCGKTLSDIKKIDCEEFNVSDCEFICLSDVKSPLFGETGAARMFARQKGADDEMIEELEKDARVCVETLSKYYPDYSNYEGSGAAGGLGFAFKTFMNAEMKSGIAELLSISKVEEVLDQDTLVITGEGKFDKQSLEGKVISGVVEMVEKTNAQLIIVAGCVEGDVSYGAIKKVFACSELGRSMEEVKKTCVEDLKRTTKDVYEYIIENNL
ncbi:MAG: glycerate kinase [Bacilli bacterium]|nr:glycerate kinase [Bacilli bacterium]